MKFLLDAHLPPSLCALFNAAGHDVIHTAGLPAENRTADRIINELSVSFHSFCLLLSPDNH